MQRIVHPTTSVYNHARLLKSNVSSQKEQVLKVMVNVTQCIHSLDLSLTNDSNLKTTEVGL